MWLVASEGEYISCSSSYLPVLCHVKSGPWYLQMFTELAPSAPSVLTANIACLERLFPNHLKTSWDSICTCTFFSHSHTDLSHFICRTYRYPKGSCSFIFFLFIVIVKDNLHILLHINAQVDRCFKICIEDLVAQIGPIGKILQASAFNRKLLFQNCSVNHSFR